MNEVSEENRQTVGTVTALFVLCALILSVILSLLLMVASTPTAVALLVGLLALLLVLWASATTERRILNSLPGGRLAEGDHPRITNLVDALCLSTGISPPQIHILPTEGRNIAALGRSANESTLIITTGLLEAATRIELEAVLANRIYQIAVSYTHLTLPTKRIV